MGEKGHRPCRQAGGLGDGGGVHCAGACGLYHARFSPAHYTWRRRDASDTAVAAGAGEI